MADKKVFRWITSGMAERDWLERMSTEGWFLKDIRWAGVQYVFRRGEPRRMAYEVERFDLAKNPSRREIEEKAQLVEMAEEMGWQMICHSVGMNYYLAKPWEEGEANELYGSPEERQRRIERYKNTFLGKMKVFLVISMVMLALGILAFYFPEEAGVDWFPVFVMGYAFVCGAFCLLMLSWTRRYEKELCLSLEEWREVYRKKDVISRWKLVFTIQGLERYLEKQAADGFQLVSMKIFRFLFVKGEPQQEAYMMDTRYLTNRRRKRAGHKPFKDSRDWEEQNNDWQVQSLYEAEAAGWECVCAVESRSILYRAPKESGARELNEKKGLRLGSAVGGAAVLMIVSGLIGGIIGGLIGYFVG